MIIFGATFSPYVRKVLTFAAEKGVEVEVRPVGLSSADEGFLAASPFRKMPAMEDDGFTLADSSAIVAYLDAKHPEPVLIPQEAQARGRVEWFDKLADTMLSPAVGVVGFNRIVGPRFLGRTGDEAAVRTALDITLPPILSYLDNQVTGRDWLVGDGFTFADLTVASGLVNLHHAGEPLSDGPHGSLARWYAAMVARPSFAALLEQDRRLVGG